jgi:hypothetical protein
LDWALLPWIPALVRFLALRPGALKFCVKAAILTITTGGMEMIGVAITGGPRHLFPFVHSVAANFAFGTENAAWMCASDSHPADISLYNVKVEGHAQSYFETMRRSR